MYLSSAKIVSISLLKNIKLYTFAIISIYEYGKMLMVMNSGKGYIRYYFIIGLHFSNKILGQQRVKYYNN